MTKPSFVEMSGAGLIEKSPSRCLKITNEAIPTTSSLKHKVLTSGKYFFFTLIFTVGLQCVYTNKIVNKRVWGEFLFTLLTSLVIYVKLIENRKQVA